MKKTATLKELHNRLATDRANRFPAVYAGAFEDAVAFARKQYRTKSSALLACEVFGLDTAAE